VLSGRCSCSASSPALAQPESTCARALAGRWRDCGAAGGVSEISKCTGTWPLRIWCSGLGLIRSRLCPFLSGGSPTYAPVPRSTSPCGSYCGRHAAQARSRASVAMGRRGGGVRSGQRVCTRTRGGWHITLGCAHVWQDDELIDHARRVAKAEQKGRLERGLGFDRGALLSVGKLLVAERLTTATIIEPPPIVVRWPPAVRVSDPAGAVRRLQHAARGVEKLADAGRSGGCGGGRGEGRRHERRWKVRGRECERAAQSTRALRGQ